MRATRDGLLGTTILATAYVPWRHRQQHQYRAGLIDRRIWLIFRRIKGSIQPQAVQYRPTFQPNQLAYRKEREGPHPLRRLEPRTHLAVLALLPWRGNGEGAVTANLVYGVFYDSCAQSPFPGGVVGLRLLRGKPQVFAEHIRHCHATEVAAWPPFFLAAMRRRRVGHHRTTRIRRACATPCTHRGHAAVWRNVQGAPSGSCRHAPCVLH